MASMRVQCSPLDLKSSETHCLQLNLVPPLTRQMTRGEICGQGPAGRVAQHLRATSALHMWRPAEHSTNRLDWHLKELDRDAALR